MTAPIVVPAELKGGKLDLNRSRLSKALKGLRDGQYKITIERAHATRSLVQNAYYFGCILPALSEHTGYTVDEIHEFCKLKFNAKQVVLVGDGGEVLDEQRIGQSTTGLNKLTFGEYCEQIRIWAASDLHVFIPDPDPDWRMNQDEAHP